MVLMWQSARVLLVEGCRPHPGQDPGGLPQLQAAHYSPQLPWMELGLLALCPVELRLVQTVADLQGGPCLIPLVARSRCWAA